MYVRINNKLSIPFGENVMKSIGSGVATNLASYAAMSGVASALKFIPGIGTIGGAVLMSAALYGLTLASGWVYLNALSLVAERKGNAFSASDISKAINDLLKDKTDHQRISLMKQKRLTRSKHYNDYIQIVNNKGCLLILT